MTHLPLDEALRRLDAVDWERIAEQITTDTGLKLYPPGARAAFRRGLVSLYTGPGTGEPAALPPESASTGLTGTNEGPSTPMGENGAEGPTCQHDPDRIENDEVTADEHERTCLVDPATGRTGWTYAADATERVNSLPTVVGTLGGIPIVEHHAATPGTAAFLTEDPCHYGHGGPNCTHTPGHWPAGISGATTLDGISVEDIDPAAIREALGKGLEFFEGDPR